MNKTNSYINIININNHIIPRTKYISFLKKLNIYPCEYKKILYYLSSKSTFIKDTNISNQQIYLFYKQAFKNNNIDQLFRLQKMLSHFVSNLLLEIINKKFLYFDKNTYKKFNDNEFINFIIKYIYNSKYKINKYSQDNLFQICSDQDMIIQFIANKYKILNNILSKKVQINNLNKIKYLDIGCGNANKTKKLSNYIGIDKKNIYGTDIHSWGPYQENKSKLGIQFEYITNNKLNYKNNSFHFISSIFNLHHVEHLKDFLKEISRILKKNGIFLLIEHDVYNDYDKLIINIQHMLYSSLYDKKKNYIENPDYIYLFNQYEWKYLLEDVGLYSLENGPLVSFDNYNPRYDNRFYGFFIKK